MLKRSCQPILKTSNQIQYSVNWKRVLSVLALLAQGLCANKFPRNIIMWIIQTNMSSTSARQKGTFHFIDLADLGEDSTPLGSDATATWWAWISVVKALQDSNALFGRFWKSVLIEVHNRSFQDCITNRTVHPCNYSYHSLHAQQSRQHNSLFWVLLAQRQALANIVTTSTFKNFRTPKKQWIVDSKMLKPRSYWQIPKYLESGTNHWLAMLIQNSSNTLTISSFCLTFKKMR